MKTEIKEEGYFLLHPKLAILVATQRAGKPNVMTAAWCTPVSDDPFIIALCLGKDSLTAGNITATKEFTLNIPTRKLLNAVWLCGTRSGRKLDKAKAARLTYGRARKISAPVINECIGHLECRLRQRHEYGECYIFIADVLSAYAEKELMKEGAWSEKAKVLLHLGSNKFISPSKLVKV